MESEDNTLSIATGNPQIVVRALEKMNASYGASFKYIGSEDRDGVEFALVDPAGSSLDQIYLLGFFIGCEVQSLRDKKSIDW